MQEPTVLIADDVIIMQQVLAGFIQALGFSQIVKCANAREIEAVYGSQRVDLAFLDIQMPEKDGLTVLQELLAVQPWVFAVMVSGQGTLNTVQQALALGARGFVVKPYTSAKIRDAVAKYHKERLT